MKNPILFILVFLITGIYAEAQLLDKLKQRAKEKGLETREVSYDSSANVANRYASNEDEELVINSAKDFFNKDIVMKLYYETNEVIHTQYFDADAIAMRTEFPEKARKPIYHDSKGFTYSYNENLGNYEKMKLLSSGMMGFMTAGMIPQYYKLPSEPYLDAFGKLEEKEIALNFLILELAFIYSPSDFEDDSNYTPIKTTCNNSNNCIKFKYNDPDYPGSYILFDDQSRLTELYINTIRSDIKEEDHPTGKFVYAYTDCSVKLPEATEQSMIPGPLGKLIPLEKGLEPWKHNKKDN